MDVGGASQVFHINFMDRSHYEENDFGFRRFNPSAAEFNFSEPSP